MNKFKVGDKIRHKQEHSRFRIIVDIEDRYYISTDSRDDHTTKDTFTKDYVETTYELFTKLHKALE